MHFRNGRSFHPKHTVSSWYPFYRASEGFPRVSRLIFAVAIEGAHKPTTNINQYDPTIPYHTIPYCSRPSHSPSKNKNSIGSGSTLVLFITHTSPSSSSAHFLLYPTAHFFVPRSSSSFFFTFRFYCFSRAALILTLLYSSAIPGKSV